MKATPLEGRIAEMIAPIATDMGFELVCVKIIGEGGSQSVQIMAEDPATKTLGIDDCTKLSKAVAILFEVEDPIKSAYRLEVSSPGIDRPLVREQDFEDYTGFEARLETDTPNEDGQRRFRGILKGIKDGQITIDTDRGEQEIPFGTLNKAKLILTDDLIKATANG